MSGSIANGRVAAIVPVYRATFLAATLESLFQQSRACDEVVLVDDGSPDRAMVEEVVAPYADRVTLVRQLNLGAAAARNRGLAQTDAEFVAFLDADDRWRPDFLRAQLRMFEQRPELDMVYADGVIVDATSRNGRTFMSECPSNGPVTVASLLDRSCNVLLSAVVVRRARLLDVGGFDESLRRGHDAELWLRLAQHGAKIDYQRAVLIERRIHDDNLSGSNAGALERAADVFEHILATHRLTAAERQIAIGRLGKVRSALSVERGKELLARGEFVDARRAFGEARRARGGWKLRVTCFGLHVAPGLMRRVYLARRRPVRTAAPDSRPAM